MVSNTPFVVPDPPLLNPIIPNGATAAQITELTRQHAVDTGVFNEYPYVETALQKQLIDSIEPLFLDAEQDQDDPSVCGWCSPTTGSTGRCAVCFEEMAGRQVFETIGRERKTMFRSHTYILTSTIQSHITTKRR
jgi:hypothetical protein